MGADVDTEKRASVDPPRDAQRFSQWRMKRLMALGFPIEIADQLAHDGQVDIHELLELVDRGCTPHLAARILAPLDGEPASQ